MSELLFIAGSARKDSVNKKLAQSACEIAKNLGADAAFIDLANYEMPLYNQDIEENDGLPKAAQDLKQLFIKSDGVCFACPEYNGSITPLLKNTIDWLSRKETESEQPLTAFKEKVGCLLAASPGKLGGIRGLHDVRSILSGIGMHMIANQLGVSDAYNKFNDNGHLCDDGIKTALRGVIETFVSHADKLGQK